MTTVLSLKIGDLVADEQGAIGTVVGFTVDGVRVRWGEAEMPICHTDEDLKVRGVVLIKDAL